MDKNTFHIYALLEVLLMGENTGGVLDLLIEMAFSS